MCKITEVFLSKDNTFLVDKTSELQAKMSQRLFCLSELSAEVLILDSRVYVANIF